MLGFFFQKNSSTAGGFFSVTEISPRELATVAEMKICLESYLPDDG
jgi:hypothetical protein